MSSPSTTATRKCERCDTDVEDFAAEFMGVRIFRRFCDPCTEVVWAEEDRRDRERELGTRLRVAGGTKRLDKFTWDEATMPHVGQDWLSAYRAGERRNLVLDGAVGAGKTGLAWLIVRDLITGEPSVGALFLNFRDLLWEIRASFDSGDAEGSLLARRAQSVSVLALDDLGAERPTPWACEQLATLIDKRYENRLPTVVTSNYSPAELAKRLGKDDPVIGRRVVSRLTEGATVVRFSNGDRRLAA